ncbi:MAG: hypothetical protein WD054_04755 [Gemmatimonadota bacterium]
MFALAAVSVALACSSGDAATRGAAVAYDTVGDTIVARAHTALWGDDVVVEEELRIGALEGAAEYTLGSIVSLTVDDEGAIYALDRQAVTVRKYDADGRHVLDIGRSGGGPGELARPQGMGFLPDGRLAVRDFGNARINFYDAAGEPVGSVPIPAAFSTTVPMHIDTAGRMYTSVMADRLPGGMSRTGFQRLASDGAVLDTVRTPRPDYESPRLVATAPDGRGTSAYGVPFWPGLQWTLDRAGNVIWGISDSYAIHTIREGRPFRITRSIEPVPVAAGEKAAAEEDAIRGLRMMQPNWTWQGPPIPDTKPFFGSLGVAHDGRIWVRLSQPGVLQPREPAAERAPDAPPPVDRWSEPSVYDVLEPDGRGLGTVTLPEGFTPMHMRGDYVWGVQRDEYDVNYITRLRIVH